MQKFDVKELELKGAYLVTPFSNSDLRGDFIKDYSFEELSKRGINYELKEVFYTVSLKNVVRAIHFQRTHQQAKLVRCIKGKVFDIIVDLRADSPTFKKYLGFYLTGENKAELLIPAGFGHGYLVMEDSIVSYKCNAKFEGEFDDGIIWNDKDINVEWPLEKGVEVILSDKDKNLQTLKEFIKKYGSL